MLEKLVLCLAIEQCELLLLLGLNLEFNRMTCQGYLDRAEEWYLACHAFSPNEPRCMYSLVSMMDQSRGVDKAYHYLQVWLIC